MFECQVTIKGNGVGQYGRFKADHTGPVSQFMVDNCYLYTQVKQHVLACPRCDPTSALRHYLDRRLTLDKFQGKPGQNWPTPGMVTGTLARLALSYERLCARSRPVSKDLVDEFLWRSADSSTICRHESRLSVRHLVAAYELMVKQASGHHNGCGPHVPKVPADTKFGRVALIMQHHARPETEQELEDLISVAEVQIT